MVGREECCHGDGNSSLELTDWKELEVQGRRGKLCGKVYDGISFVSRNVFPFLLLACIIFGCIAGSMREQWRGNAITSYIHSLVRSVH